MSTAPPSVPGVLFGRLRADLHVVPMSGRESHFVVEDPVRGQFYRLGVAEYDALTQWSAAVPPSEIVVRSAARFGEAGIGERQLRELLAWARSSHLLEADPEAGPKSEGWSDLKGDSGLSVRHPFYMRISFGSPHRWIDVCQPWVAWIFSRPLLAGWLALVMGMAVVLWTRLDEFLATWANLLSPGRALGAFVIWLVIKVAHETGHAIVCRRLGGEVRDAGMSLILLAPIAYVDVTSAWHFRRRRDRIATSLAGIYVETWIAACATVVWVGSDAPLIRQLAADTIFVTTVSTVLFNLNPLMKFDGYYVLADLIDAPNLATQGSRQVAYLFQRWVLGARVRRPATAPRLRRAVQAYGVGALLWRILVVISLVSAASLIYHGLGLVVAVAGAAFYSAAWVRSARRIWAAAALAPGFRRGVAVVRLAAFAAALIGATAWIPTRPATRVTGIVRYAPHRSVRPTVDGFVRRIHVRAGESVHAGDPIVDLENDSLMLDAESARIEVREAEAQVERYRAEGDALELKLAEAELDGRRRRADELQRQVEALRLVAPVEGVVVSRVLDSLEGAFVQAGQEIAVVGREDTKELAVLVPQQEGVDPERFLGRPLSVSTPAGFLGHAECVAVDPQARTELPHPALGARFGGPLAVRQDEQGRDVLADPHFVLRMELDAATSVRLYEGQRAFVTLDARGPTLWRIAAQRVQAFERSWVRR